LEPLDCGKTSKASADAQRSLSGAAHRRGNTQGGLSLVALTPAQTALCETACRLYYAERKSTAEVARLLREPEHVVWNLLAHCSKRHRSISRKITALFLRKSDL